MALRGKKLVDLCAGTGAFSYVFQKYGVEVVFANDCWKPSADIYQLNILELGKSGVFTLADLNQIQVEEKIPDHQILCAGFPCQPFSIAGKQEGFDDQRSNIFWKILEILEKRQPEIIVLENVKNLMTHDKGNTYQVIKDNLELLGYHLKVKIIDTCKVTQIPQHRERIYILGFRDQEMSDSFSFDAFSQDKQNKQISDFLEASVAPKYYYTDKLKVYPQVSQGVVKLVEEDNTLYQYRRYYVRENKSNCCPTLTANMGSGGHNVPLLRNAQGIRKLTPRECFSLQGFPLDYKLGDNLSDSMLYKLAGNAVSLPVIDLIAQELARICAR